MNSFELNGWFIAFYSIFLQSFSIGIGYIPIFTVRGLKAA